MRNDSIANGGDGIVNKNTPVLIYATAVSIFCFGGMIGGLMAGTIAEALGRKWAIILNNILVFVAALLMGNVSAYCTSLLFSSSTRQSPQVQVRKPLLRDRKVGANV